VFRRCALLGMHNPAKVALPNLPMAATVLGFRFPAEVSKYVLQSPPVDPQRNQTESFREICIEHQRIL